MKKSDKFIFIIVLILVAQGCLYTTERNACFINLEKNGNSSNDVAAFMVLRNYIYTKNGDTINKADTDALELYFLLSKKAELDCEKKSNVMLTPNPEPI